MSEFPPVLDACCGGRMFWFDRSNPLAVFVDKRTELCICDRGTEQTKGRKPMLVDPDIIADFTSLPFPDSTFYLVVFDPPHLTSLGENSLLGKKYGRLLGDWRCEIQEGFSECWRVLRTNGVLVFKWNSLEVSLEDVLALAPERPLFGHRSGKASKTHWVCFMKP